MTVNIQNLTGIIYGWFLGILSIMPSMVEVARGLSHGWLRGIFYIGCLIFIIPFIIERSRLICLLNHALSFQRLYKREIIAAVLMLLISLIPSISIISILIGGYHLYWVYQTYSIFGKKAGQGERRE